MFTRSAARVGRMVRKATENQSRSDEGLETTGCIGGEVCLSVGKSWCLLPPKGGMPTRPCAILISLWREFIVNSHFAAYPFRLL